MKLLNITNMNRFLDVVSECKGKVEMVTGEGDRLDLKSQLCKYITLAKTIKSTKIDEVEVELSEPEDAGILLSYMMNG